MTNNDFKRLVDRLEEDDLFFLCAILFMIGMGLNLMGLGIYEDEGLIGLVFNLLGFWLWSILAKVLILWRN